jgi:hypothetical protein
MKTTKCAICEKDISNSGYRRHMKACQGKKNWVKHANGEYECLICHHISSKSGIGNHVKYHFGYENPRLGVRGTSCWNFGLTKETSETIKKAGQTFSRRVKEGKIIPSGTDRPPSEDTRKKWKANPNMGEFERVRVEVKKGNTRVIIATLPGS